MEIKEYENNPYHLAQLVDLINYCQNIEAKLDIKMAETRRYFSNRKLLSKQKRSILDCLRK